MAVFRVTGTVDPRIGVVVDGDIKWRPPGMSDVRWRIERRRLSNLNYYNSLSDAEVYPRAQFG